MGLSVRRCFEYVFECDDCGAMDVVHTGDSVSRGEVVHDKESARRVCKFHTSNGKVLCDECFLKRQVEREKVESGYYRY